MSQRKNPEYLVTLKFQHLRYLTISEREGLAQMVANNFGGTPEPVGNFKAKRIDKSRRSHRPYTYNSFVTIRIKYPPNKKDIEYGIKCVEEAWPNWLGFATDKGIELQAIEHVESWSKYRY